MTPLLLSRRRFLLASAAALQTVLASQALAGGSDLEDRGIGGTGASISGDQTTDHGIGGTGIVGTIQGFGSIIVNDVRIPYETSTPIFIDGRRVSANAMRVGHVVRVLVSKGNAKSIYVTSEVIGPIERLDSAGMTVLSQRIDLSALGNSGLRKGLMVAVFGIRKPDGTIVARRVETRPRSTPLLLRGTPVRTRGRISIDGLALGERHARFVGKQVLVSFIPGRKKPTIYEVSLDDIVPGLRRGVVNVETYGRQEHTGIKLGVGISTSMHKIDRRDGDEHMFIDLSIRGSTRLSGMREGRMRPNSERPGPPSDRGPPPDGWGDGPPPDRRGGPWGPSEGRSPDPRRREWGPGHDRPRGPDGLPPDPP